jgi:hypothetical protein
LEGRLGAEAPLYAAMMLRSPAAWLLSLLVGMAALAPSAAAAPPNPAVQLSALSCRSAGNCGAIGSYDDDLGDSQGLLVTQAHGKWQRGVEAQAPAGAAADAFRPADGGGLVDISCPGVGDCTAIGRYTDSAETDHGGLFSESHSRWTPGTRMQLPANAVRPVKPKAGGVIDDLGLAAVSCSSVGNCVAVGNYETDAEVWDAMLVSEHNGHWARAVEAPLPAGAPVAGQDAVLLTVTCSSGGTCTAAGKYVDAAGHQQGLLISGANGSWTAAPAPAAPSDANSDPNIVPSSVACTSTGDCAAVGTYVNPLENSLGLIFSESGGSWAAATSATLPADAAPAGTVGDQTAVLASVACPQAGGCTAVGWYFDNDENGQALLVSQLNGSWQPGVEVTLPANAVGGLEKQSAGLDWISCANVGNCLATGVYTDSGYNSQGLLVSEVGGVWQTAVESPLPANAGNIQYAATDQSDCTGVGDCTVIGEYDDSHGNVLGDTISETNGSWGPAVELALPPANLTEVRLSLDAILEPYGKTGSLARIRSARSFVFDYAAVVPGSALTSWYATQKRQRVLIATGQAQVSGPGSDKLTLHLTSAGRTLLAGAKHIRVSASAQFTPRGSKRVQQASVSFTLR